MCGVVNSMNAFKLMINTILPYLQINCFVVWNLILSHVTVLNISAHSILLSPWESSKLYNSDHFMCLLPFPQNQNNLPKKHRTLCSSCWPHSVVYTASMYESWRILSNLNGAVNTHAHTRARTHTHTHTHTHKTYSIHLHCTVNISACPLQCFIGSVKVAGIAAFPDSDIIFKF